MAKDVPVSVSLSDTLLLALGRLAHARGTRPSDELDAILRAVLLTPLTVEQRLANIGREASDWVELQHRLRIEGFALRIHAEQGLQLCTWPKIRPLMPAAEAGLDLLELTLRFKTRFPFPTSQSAQCAEPTAAVRLVA